MLFQLASYSCHACSRSESSSSGITSTCLIPGSIWQSTRQQQYLGERGSCILQPLIYLKDEEPVVITEGDNLETQLKELNCFHSIGRGKILAQE
ncbi:hypothetical protein CY35_04G007900 [Sphagnum magellanicum]|nr:hypothetical protein CY35_04G007900 [Sphagnum magellanicum]